jgi:hypothetical protein
MQKESQRADLKIRMVEIGQSTKRKSSKYERLNKQWMKTWNNYDNTEDFKIVLRTASYMLGPVEEFLTSDDE